MLVTGKLDNEHLENLEEVLRHLDSFGLKLKCNKCVFIAPEVEFLGGKVTATGVMPYSKSLTDAIRKAPKPDNVSELRAFLGLLNYSGNFFARFEQCFRIFT